MNSYIRMLSACAFGAVAGGFISLELAEMFAFGSYFWVVGSLIGGALAYLVYDLKGIRNGAVVAFEKTIAWKPNVHSWKAYWFMSLGLSALVTTWSWLMGLVIYFTTDDLTLYELVGFLPITTASVAGIAFTLGLFFVSDSSHTRNEERIDGGWKMFKYTNPLLAPFWLYYGAYRALLLLPAGVVLVTAFAKQIFVEIHSDKRTICFIDASLGATAGYFVGSAFIGGAVGVFAGLVSYELIARRLLKIDVK